MWRVCHGIEHLKYLQEQRTSNEPLERVDWLQNLLLFYVGFNEKISNNFKRFHYLNDEKGHPRTIQIYEILSYLIVSSPNFSLQDAEQLLNNPQDIEKISFTDDNLNDLNYLISLWSFLSNKYDPLPIEGIDALKKKLIERCATELKNLPDLRSTKLESKKKLNDNDKEKLQQYWREFIDNVINRPDKLEEHTALFQKQSFSILKCKYHNAVLIGLGLSIALAVITCLIYGLASGGVIPAPEILLAITGGAGMAGVFLGILFAMPGLIAVNEETAANMRVAKTYTNYVKNITLFSNNESDLFNLKTQQESPAITA